MYFFSWIWFSYLAISLLLLFAVFTNISTVISSLTINVATFVPGSTQTNKTDLQPIYVMCGNVFISVSLDTFSLVIFLRRNRLAIICLSHYSFSFTHTAKKPFLTKSIGILRPFFLFRRKTTSKCLTPVAVWGKFYSSESSYPRFG